MVDEKQKNDWQYYFNELMSEECACGETKKPGHAFCYSICYSNLPKELRRALYKRIGQGYEEAYEEARRYLEENVW